MRACGRPPSARSIPAFAALLAVAGLASAVPAGSASQELPRLGPKDDASVYWVGHSLVEGKDQSSWGEISLMTLVGRFADARGLGYRMGDHTLWGSPMSALWRGRPHGYERDASDMVAKREDFQRNAGQYDTLVLTESLPVGWAARNEYSAYYLRRFGCTLTSANPAARLYLYQTWVNLQPNDPGSKLPPAHRFDWRAEMLAQREVWENIADEASRPKVRAPGGWFSRLGWSATSDGGCDSALTIFIVPVGQALVALSDRLAAPQAGDHFAWPHGNRLTLADLFRNPFVDWPEDWPVSDDSADIDPAAALAGLTLRNPQEPHDDIHASGIGIYFAALVHFATLYRQSPVGLPAPDEIGPDLARTLQCIAWSSVVGDPRAGVLGEGTCEPV